MKECTGKELWFLPDACTHTHTHTHTSPFNLFGHYLYFWGQLIYSTYFRCCRGGAFLFTFAVPHTYPHDPPKVKCLTKVYHPNIDLEGNVCLNILREDWKPVLTITSVVYGLNFLFLVSDSTIIILPHQSRVANGYNFKKALLRNLCRLPIRTIH
jgi:ubiquitin-protein ligase